MNTIIIINIPLRKRTRIPYRENNGCLKIEWDAALKRKFAFLKDVLVYGRFSHDRELCHELSFCGQVLNEVYSALMWAASIRKK